MAVPTAIVIAVLLLRERVGSECTSISTALGVSSFVARLAGAAPKPRHNNAPCCEHGSCIANPPGVIASRQKPRSSFDAAQRIFAIMGSANGGNVQ
jgi:hypothetical protein